MCLPRQLAGQYGGTGAAQQAVVAVAAFTSTRPPGGDRVHASTRSAPAPASTRGCGRVEHIGQWADAMRRLPWPDCCCPAPEPRTKAASELRTPWCVGVQFRSRPRPRGQRGRGHLTQRDRRTQCATALAYADVTRAGTGWVVADQRSLHDDQGDLVRGITASAMPSVTACSTSRAWATVRFPGRVPGGCGPLR